MVAVEKECNYECLAFNLDRSNSYCVSDGLVLTFYANEDFKRLEQIEQIQVVQGKKEDLRIY